MERQQNSGEPSKSFMKSHTGKLKQAMPRQNRVTPFGQIIATPERGTFLGNRGILHDDQGNIRRGYAVRRWIVCDLEFRGRKRTIMKPNSYTELFFLDEATAFAAGHRPCAECRHSRFLDYCAAWKRARGLGSAASRPTADEMDNALHAERIDADRSKVLFKANLDDLPDGVFVMLPGDETPFLVRQQHLQAWSPGGYSRRIERPAGACVSVITPRSSVAVIRQGYLPDIHHSAELPR